MSGLSICLVHFTNTKTRSFLPEQIGSWGNFGVFTYLLFPEGLDVKAFEEKMQGMYAAYMEPIFGPE